MKFTNVTDTKLEESALREEYKNAHEVGVIRAGDAVLFFRVRFKTYYIPFADIRRIFRRVMEVPAKMCCGRGDFAIENLVVCDENKELAVIQLPGEKAAKLLIAELKKKLPEVDFSAPRKAAEA